jgi:hypothetical protein
MNDQERDDLIDRVSQALDVPEPSPLFWEHFPGRVRAAVASEPANAPGGWWQRRLVMLAVPAAFALALAAWTMVPRESAEPVDADVMVTADAAASDEAEMIEDADWAAVSSVAESAGIDMLREAGFGVAPGAADAAIEDLDAAARADLVAMLRAEMKGDGFSGL